MPLSAFETRLTATFDQLQTEAQKWIEYNSSPENQVRSGPWSPEEGAKGPLLPANYAITVHDEAVGGIGIDFGSGASVQRRANLTDQQERHLFPHWRIGILDIREALG